MFMTKNIFNETLKQGVVIQVATDMVIALYHINSIEIEQDDIVLRVTKMVVDKENPENVRVSGMFDRLTLSEIQKWIGEGEKVFIFN